MLAGMGLLLDSFWRATAYCLHKRVIAWSLFPLLFMAITAWLLGYFFWADAVVWTEGVLQGVGWLHTVWSWMGVQSLPELVAPYWSCSRSRRCWSWSRCCWWRCS